MKLETLEKDNYYHIYNRGINGCAIFEDKENMRYFLSLVLKYLKGKATLLSYCLLQNHYHFLLKVNVDNKEIIQAFSNLFNAYAKAFNKRNHRTGSLFEKHFKRKRVKSEEYLRNTILYIHKNPEHHKISKDFSKYDFSSYKDVVSENATLIDVSQVVSVFENLDNFIFTHKNDHQTDLQGF
ncbi:MAG: hypothetical protein P8K77_02630 [Polaribacter sp.]|nr:hypothetical protein [Polaribacter sp.]